MSSFMDLVGFEYKKIFKRKSFIFAILIMLLMSTFCMVAPALMGGSRSVNYGPPKSNLEHMRIWQTAAHGVAGYLDANMVNSIIEKNVLAQEALIDGDRYPDDVFEECLLPYQGLRWNIISVFSPLKGEYAPFGSLKSGKGIDFYALRTAGMEARMKESKFSQAEINATLRKNSSVSEPFYFDYFDGYSVFLSVMATSSIFIVFALVMCVAPIFADEYQKKTDAIILSSRFGKNKLIHAKIFTTTTFSLLFTIMALIIALVTTFSVYSTIGGNVSFQLFAIFSAYPLTMAKAVLIYCPVIVCAALLLTAFCTFLSSRFGSFGAVVTTLLLLVGGLFINISVEGLRILNYFLPTKMMDSRYVFSNRLVNAFGLYIEPYIFIPIICFAMVAIFLPLAYRAFKNHQVG